MQIPLVRHTFEDESVTLMRRGVDSRWLYDGFFRGTVTGFNPLSSTLFYGTHSHVDRWIRNRQRDARDFNYNDKLVNELMFVVHDYLHLWAYQWVHHLAPREVGFGVKALTADNIEDHVFCHLVTEAAATVGLDYWYLSTLKLNEVCDIGSNFGELTVSYRQEHEPEYRRFSRGFTAQRPSFFRDVASFYCTGRFKGFSKRDLGRSPRLLGWLSHELGYGVLQRQYAREWYAYMSRRQLAFTPKQVRRPVRCSKPWQRQVMDQVGELLWDKVKNDRLNVAPRLMPRDRVWRAGSRKDVDFRFTNLNCVDMQVERKRIKLDTEDKFRFFFRQFVARLDYAKAPAELMQLSKALVELRDLDVVRSVFRGLPRIRKTPGEPRDIFFLT